VYEKSIGTKMNDIDLCLDVVSRSCQPLRYIRRWISRSRKPLAIEAWFERTTNRKGTWYQMVMWPIWRHVPQRCCEAVRSAAPSDSLSSCCYANMRYYAEGAVLLYRISYPSLWHSLGV